MALDRDKKHGIIGSVIVHAVVILLLMIFGFSTPLPLPGEEGVEVRLGTDDAGGVAKKVAPVVPKPNPKPKTETVQPKPQPKEEIVKQDTEEAPEIEPEQEKKTEETEKIKQEEVIEKEPEKTSEAVDSSFVEEETIEEPDPEPVVNPAALYKGKTDGNGGSGEDADKTGVKGKAEGDPSSDKTDGLGGQGNGVSFKLEGRGSIYLKEPAYNSKEQGRVVVEIIVDQQGNVVRALAGKKVPGTSIGTTVTDQSLWRLAADAAKKSTFTADPSAAEGQKGYIIYNFIRLN